MSEETKAAPDHEFYLRDAVHAMRSEKHAAACSWAAMEITKLRAMLSMIDAHWNEFGPEHGFGEVMDRASDYLASLSQPESTTP